MFDFHFDKTLPQPNQAKFKLQIQLQSQADTVVIMGASGSGKSLMLKAIAGFLTPDNGHIIINQQHVFSQQQKINLTPQQRHLAYVFQDYALFPHLTVRQNIAFGISKSWWNPSNHRRHPQVEYWLDTLKLTHIANQYPLHLSGGQRQRTALARALITQPQAILLDEPFSALDIPLRQQMRQELAYWQQTLQLPMLLITHDQADADAFDAEIWLMNNGKLQAAMLSHHPTGS
ncbi:ATP-binding cassette domain-containing protein [Neisseriaceae bacterium ESL0693]|nr:ATP-binding cassette domain-containing protein [Neisseriaceae bacterium ESL0693]